jgi:plasmid replication initiation protein
MDRRKTQISLPLNLPDKGMKDNVKQHWNITFARQGKISVVAKRMMALVLAQIQENDNKLKSYFELHASDVIVGSDSGKVYKDIKQAFRDLASAVWMIEDIDSNRFEPRNLLDTTKTEKKDGFRTAYDNGRITIALNPALEDYFIALSHYSRYELKNYMKFKSWYSMRFWEILSAYQDTGKWNVPLAEYRKLMDCEKKYKDVNLMIQKTTAEPLEELKGTELEFSEPQKVFAKYHGKGRPPVVGLEFKLVKSLLNDDEVLSEWAKHSPEHARMITKLHHDWKITQACLRKYLPIIKMEGARKLLRQFEQMEGAGTKRKIDSKEKYCNAAIKRFSDEIQKGKK